MGITWGLGYRHTEDKIQRSFEFSATPDSEGVSLYNAFVQGDLVLFPDLLRVTAGTKVEHNPYTGFEIQPSGRFALTPGPGHTIWGAVSRAVRTPSRVEENTTLQGVTAPGTASNPGPLPFVFRLGGDGEFESEELIAYEIGHRWKLTPSFGLDTALFYNKYENLGTAESGAAFTEGSPFPTRLVLPVSFRNKMDGEAFGGEIVAKWRATRRLRLEAHYGLLKLFLHPDSDSTDTANEQAEGASPQQQASLRGRYDLGNDWDFDANLRYVDELPALNIDAYVELDLRLAWSPWKGTEFSIVGRNLLDSAHQEFTPTFLLTDPSEVERSVYIKATTRF